MSSLLSALPSPPMHIPLAAVVLVAVAGGNGLLARRLVIVEEFYKLIPSQSAHEYAAR